MSISRIFKPYEQDGVKMTAIYLRIRKRCSVSGTLKTPTDIKVSTSLAVNTEEWDKYQNNKRQSRTEKLICEEVEDYLKRIEHIIEGTLDLSPIMTSKEAHNIINSIVNADAIRREEERKLEEEQERKRKEDAQRMTLNKFIDQYIEDTENGSRQTNRGTNFKKGTIKAIKQSMVKFRQFQEYKHREYDFEDIDMNFYNDFRAFLNKEQYSINTIGKAFKELKTILSAAEVEGFNTNTTYRNAAFKAKRVEVDSIYLTENDLRKMQSADLSGLPKCYEEARDIFMVGVWTAQRVSDYNNISKDQIRTSTMQTIQDGKIVERELTIIEIKQKKTGQKVSIPVNSQLKSILEKYDYSLPHLWEQKINDYIKEVGRIAGLTEEIEITSTKGGTPHQIRCPKYSLIHTHTARRTGATLMYLSGMEIYDVMRITGHSSPIMLKKYIKADSLEVAEKIADKYEYFK